MCLLNWVVNDRVVAVVVMICDGGENGVVVVARFVLKSRNGNVRHNVVNMLLTLQHSGGQWMVVMLMLTSNVMLTICEVLIGLIDDI